MRLRLMSFLFATVMLLTVFPAWSTPVFAAYENTYVNTGNMAADIIGVALTQVGYKEGSNNYTKYGEWFGHPNSPWCGIFVAWCADQANIPYSILKKYAKSDPAGYGLQELDGKTYRPKPGDLFFKRGYTHVGIVYYLDGDYFYTLEGNTGSSSDGVCIRRRKISDYVFGSPNYRGGAEHSYTTGCDAEHPHKEYKACTNCSDKYYTGNTVSVRECTACIQATCSHSYNPWCKTDNSRHSRTCLNCGKVQTDDHNWNQGTVTVAPTCAKSGSKDQSCTDCGAERTLAIPKTDDHEFDEKIYTDDTTHTRVCNICAFKDSEKHTVNDHWYTDGYNHWYECDECGDRYRQDVHSFPDGCESCCEVCGNRSSEGHIPDVLTDFDKSGHWYNCTKCDAVTGFSEHNYSAECDDRCDLCGYIRLTTHTYGSELESDPHGHWLQCIICGLQTDLESHCPDMTAPDWEALLCTTCSYEVRSANDHVHTLHTVHNDTHTHWGLCACGEEISAQPHIWSMQTQSCSVCGEASTTTQDEVSVNHAVYWILIGFGAVGLILLITFTCLKLGKKRTPTAV